MAFLDLTGLTRYTTKMKAWVSSLIKNNSTTTSTGYALDASQAPLLKVLKKSYGSISAMGTISDSDVTADMVVVGSQLGTPSAQKSNWTVTAMAGSFTLSGTISGSTTLTIFWARSRGTGNQTSVIPKGDNAYGEQNTDIGKVKNNKNLGEFATITELNTALDAELASMDNSSNLAIRFSFNATALPFRNTYHYYGTLFKSSTSTVYSHMILYPAANSNPIDGRRNASGWSYDYLLFKSDLQGYFSLLNVEATIASVPANSYASGDTEVTIPDGYSYVSAFGVYTSTGMAVSGIYSTGIISGNTYGIKIGVVNHTNTNATNVKASGRVIIIKQM